MTSMSERAQYWNAFYTEKPHAFGKAPTSFLVDMMPRLKKGKVLDVGMGEGRNAVFLAQKGCEVRGIDLSERAVMNAQKLAQDTGVSIDAKVADLDLFLMGLFEYDSIIMTYFKPPLTRYYSEMVRALKQGGTLLVESHTVEEARDHKEAMHPHADYFFQPNELIRHLQGLRILFYNESLVDNHHVVQCLAMKPVDKDAAKYGFNIQSGSENTGPSAQQKLAESLFKKKE